MEVEAIRRFVGERAMDDPEFARAMRYFTGWLKIAIDDDETGFRFDDGKLVASDGVGVPADSDAEIVARGTREQWNAMLEEFPKPFYQCLQTTSIRHGLYLNNTNDLYAYLPALNRLTSLLRAENGKLAGAAR